MISRRKYIIVHVVYLMLILLISTTLGYKTLVSWTMGPSYFIRIERDIELREARSHKKIGYLKKGVLLRSPDSLEDYDGTDPVDGRRLKILLDFVDFDFEHATRLDDVKDELFSPWIYANEYKMPPDGGSSEH